MAGAQDSVLENSDGFAHRHAVTFLEKFDRFESQELLANASTHWLLSTEDYKIRTEPPSGLVSKMLPITGFFFNALMPVDESVDALDLREVHQIIKELTIGIYVMNQVPTINLEANFDESTTCQLPPAYIDTRVGQILINVDYVLKALWHGVYFNKEKRTKFADRWRVQLDVDEHGKPQTKKPVVTEFIQEGIMDINKDPDFKGTYDDLPGEVSGDKTFEEERKFFMHHVNDLSLRLTFFQNSVAQYKNLFVVDAEWTVSSVLKLMSDQLDNAGYERLYAQLQLHEMVVQDNLLRKEEVRKNLYLLKLISFLVPLLVGMRKQMKIPDIQHMLPNMTGDDIRTEREIAPLILPDNTKCKIFNFGKHYFNLHGGILIDMETDPPASPYPEIVVAYEQLQRDASHLLARWLDPNAPPQEIYSLPVTTVSGKKYYNIGLEFETFYPQSPQKPNWVHTLVEESHILRYKRLPIQDSQLHEMFKQFFGVRLAIKYKNQQNGLRAAACRGLVAAFMTLCRKCQVSRLSAPFETGLTLMHYAAIHNRPQIIAILLQQGVDINIRRSNFTSSGPTPLHIAAKCGSLDAVSCLLANYANAIATDQDGWAPIHFAAYFNNEHIIRMMIRKNDALLELQTKNELRSTPLLLAASSGALSAVKCFIDLGGYILRKDSQGNNVIHLAALRFHVNVLEFFMQWDHRDVPVWQILVGMLGNECDQKKDAAVKCLEIMSTSKEDHWKFILEASGVPALVKLLKHDNKEICTVAVSVLCNISQHDPVRDALTKANAGPILIELLTPCYEETVDSDEIQSRAAIVLSDLACVGDNQETLAGAIPPLVHLLKSSVEDVLINTVNALRILCMNNRENQAAVAENGAITHLVEFLTIDSEKLQAGAAVAIAAVAGDNDDIKYLLIDEGVIEPLVSLIEGLIMEVQVKAASALESLCLKNADCQRSFLERDATTALMQLFSKVWSLEEKEQTACAIWSLAGNTKPQQKEIATNIGIPHLTDTLLSSSEKLQYVGCMGMIALSREDMENQNKIANQGGIIPLVRLLRSPKTTSKVLLAVIKTLGTLCVGLAHHHNEVTQEKIAEEGALFHLVELLVNAPTEEIQVQVAITLGCLVLGNPVNQKKMQKEPNFTYNVLLDLLELKDKGLRIKAGFAVAVFAFNNTPQQLAIRQAGGISYKCFDYFLNSVDDYEQCHAAFQIVVLAKVIVDKDQVSLTANGVTQLVSKLEALNDDVVILAASLLSSLAHTRAGITDAMFTIGAVEALMPKLESPNDQVRFACAVALGYLTFNRTAARKMLVAVRNTPGLYELMIHNMGKNPKISQNFTDEFETQKQIGIPCLSLEKHGGPSCNTFASSNKKTRPKTSQSLPTPRKPRIPKTNRAMSASAVRTRVPSAGSSRTATSMSQYTATDSSFLKTKLASWQPKSN